ncbi:unnamed protein product [marine sediment metagenome]|uniref:Uncharacterized protein n=1 Tax=marine sediment metagenome TaxID=412755 RepID=X1NPY5_9ZZZZ
MVAKEIGIKVIVIDPLSPWNYDKKAFDLDRQSYPHKPRLH